MTGLILLTYGQIGDELLKAATHIMNLPIEHIQMISVYDQPDTADKLPAYLKHAIEQSGPENQCLILTDLHGCTHFNIARKFVNPSHVALVSGLNLAMLLRVLNHQDENLVTLSQYAEEGGVMGISTISEAQAEGCSDRKICDQ
jgi:mannose/fructose-specific phosphotransferase system component IIA